LKTLVWFVVAVLWLTLSPLAIADETNAIADIVAILQQKGLIDAATGEEILAKEERSEAKRAAATPAVAAGSSLVEGLVWNGEFRLRDEQFWYGRAFGGTADDNNRFRYRARLGFTKQVNPWALVGFRLASGTGDYRSTNVSFGEQSNWSPYAVYIDRAYGQFTLPDPGGIGLSTTLTAGRISNPFIWKSSLDKIVWDAHDYAVDVEIAVRAFQQGLKSREVAIGTVYHDAHKGVTVLDGLRLLFRLVGWRFTL